MGRTDGGARLMAALSDIVNDGDLGERSQGAMVTGYFTIVEMITPEGDRWLDWLYSEGTKVWQLKGWLHQALDMQLIGQIEDERAD